jgi:hypothetical protein
MVTQAGHCQLARKFRLALGFQRVGNVMLRPLRHPALGVIALLPGAIGGVPHIWKLDNSPRDRDRLERAHRVAQDSALKFGVIRFAGLMTERKVQEHRPRWFDRTCDVERGSHAQGRYPSFLHCARYQSNGLMTDGSCGDEKKRIHVRALQLVDDLRRQFVANFS